MEEFLKECLTWISVAFLLYEGVMCFGAIKDWKKENENIY